jgi:hypothetical protein
VSIRLLNRHTRNPFRSCISRSTSQSHSLSDSISQRASLFTYHLVRTGYSPVPSSRFTLITSKTLVSSPTDYASSGSGSEHRIVTYAELATDPTQLKSSRACHRHVTTLDLPKWPNIFPVFHSSEVRPFIENDATHFPEQALTPPEPVAINGHEEFFIDKIVDQHRRG